MSTVVVVGGGIAGVAAAYAVGRDAPPGTEVILVDGADRLGGKLRVSPVAGLAVDEGAEAMLARVPDGTALAAEVGLGDELVPVATSAASIVSGGRLVPFPGGTAMGVPGDPETVRDVLPPGARDRIAAEADAQWPPVEQDVTVGHLVADRLGREVVDRLVDPLLGGVYAGPADGLSLQATVPGLAQELRAGGSLVRAAGRAAAAVRGTGPVFTTVRSGLGVLPGAVARASRATVRLGLPVRKVTRAGTGFRLEAGPIPDPVYLDADAVIVAVPAQKAAGMLEPVAPWAAAELRAIEYASMAIVTLAYRGLDLPAGSGALVPAVEGGAVKAVTFSSRKWAHLGGGPAIVRGSVGRFGDERVLHRDDADLADLVAAELGALLGTGQRPVELRVTRWGGALPQYALGHVDRVRRIRQAVDAVPGLAVCGAAYDGVGIPACIRTAAQAAARIHDHLTPERESTYG